MEGPQQPVHVVDECEASGMPKRQPFFWLFVFWIALAPVWGARGQVADEALLARLAEITAAPPTGDWEADEKAARDEYKAAWEAFTAYLDASGPEVRASWERYLEWRNLNLLANPAVKLNEEVIERLRRQFRQNAAGFEYAPFVRVRNALDRLGGVAMRTENANLAEAYSAKVNALIAALRAQNESVSESTRMDAVAALDWLRRTGLAPNMVDQVLAPHRQPNLIITVGSGMTQHAIREPVDDTQPVEDVILGTQIYATARTTGVVTARPASCNHAAQLNLLLSGVSHSTSVGYNGPATIYSRGATTVEVCRPLFITKDGLVAGSSTACCSTNTVIDDICTRSKLVNRIAWKKAYKSKSEAEAIASDHAETRAERNFDSRSQKLIDEANANLREKFLTPMARIDSQPELLQFSSDERALRIAALVAKPWHFAAPTAPPAVGDFDVIVRLHDTFVGNASENALGGFTLTDEKLAQLMQEYTGNVPEELQITEDKDPWSITFSSYQPFGMEVSGNQVRFVVRGKRFSRADRVIRNSVDISATYLIERTPQGSRLVRQGDVSVEFRKLSGTLSAPQVAFRSFLRKKFENLFKSEFVSEGITPKGKFAKIGRLQIAHIAAENGWLVLAWNRAPAASPTPAPNVETAAAADSEQRPEANVAASLLR